MQKIEKSVWRWMSVVGKRTENESLCGLGLLQKNSPKNGTFVMGSLGPSWITIIFPQIWFPTLVLHSTRVGEGDHATCPFKYLKAIWFVDIYGPAAREGRWWSDLVEGVIMTVNFTGGISSLVVVFVCDDTNLWTMTTRRTRGSASEKTWNLSGESRVNSVCSGTGAQWGGREEVKGGGGNNCLVDMVYIKSTMRRNRFWKANSWTLVDKE